mgnify:CR=1 FL=1
MEYGEIFREEAQELLEELETALLELEKSPEDLEIVGRVFRVMHTIKGSGSMFGFDDIANFTHHVETVLDKVRSGQAPVTKDLIDLTLESRDHIKSLLEATSGVGEADPATGKRIIQGLEALVGKSENAEETAVGEVETETPPEIYGEGVPAHYRIHFAPTREFFEQSGDVDKIIEELKTLGECTVFIHEQKPGENQEGQPEETLEILLTTSRGEDTVRDVFIFAESSSTIKVEELARQGGKDFFEHKRLGEILIERGELDQDNLMQILDQQNKPLGELLVDAKLVSKTQVEAALAEQKIINKNLSSKAGKGSDSIRVAADKLDSLINLVGELVVTQARLSDISSTLANASELIEPVEGVERLTAELRDCVLNIRMLPIGTTFARFRRLVRDLSAELGKEVRLETDGAETELDKSVIDQLADPLVHLIRNSLDHGIETPDVREAAGKPRQGMIKPSCRRQCGHQCGR